MKKIFYFLLCFPFLLGAESNRVESDSITPMVSGPQPILGLLPDLNGLVYQGSAKIDGGSYGESNGQFGWGRFCYNETNNSIFYIGKRGRMAANKTVMPIAEFAIPDLVKNQATDLSTLNKLDVSPIQAYITPWTRIESNPDDIKVIMGMEFINGQLIVNGEHYYDNAPYATRNTFVFKNASSLSNSSIDAWYSVTGGNHSSGWISPIPVAHQAALGGDYIMGNGKDLPIASGHSIGPSAFSLNINDILNDSPGAVSSTALIDYPLNKRIHEDKYNLTGINDIWTDVSKVKYGFIVPGTDTYLVIGTSGGHNSYLGYKITQDNGRKCGGPCVYDANDFQTFYWMYDVNDMVRVKNRKLAAYDIKPYKYGPWVGAPFQKDRFRSIAGADYDSINDRLLIMTEHSDHSNKTFVLSAFSGLKLEE